MPEYREPLLFILGYTLQDAQNKYRELVSDEPASIFGKRVQIGSTYTPLSVKGLVCDEYVVTERAKQHQRYDECVAQLEIALIKRRPRTETND